MRIHAPGPWRQLPASPADHTVKPTRVTAAKLRAELAIEHVARLEHAVAVRRHTGSWDPYSAANATDIGALSFAEHVAKGAGG